MSKNVTLLNAQAQQISKRVRRHAAGLVDADFVASDGCAECALKFMRLW